MSIKLNRNTLAKCSLYVFYGLLAYMPLHILLSTWIGTTFGVLPLAKVFKDIVLVAGFGLVLAVTPPRQLKELSKNRLVQLIAAYAALTLLMALIKPTDQDAETLGVVYNTRFLLMFLYGLLLTAHFSARHMLIKSAKIVLAAAAAVMVFGLLQYLVLSPTALSHLGYSRANGVLPFFAIDDKPDLERIMSTLRDPNSYGSYLIIVGALASSLLLCTKKAATKKIAYGLLGLAGINLLLTFSRSAWIGFALMLAATAAVTHHRQQILGAVKRYTPYGLVVLAIVSVGLFAAKDSYFVQNVIFHADESTVLEDPNQKRSRFLQESIDAVADNPLGYGPGTAGLSSIRNDQKTVLNENYYLQIAYETGIAGLVLFMTILAMVASRLYDQRGSLYGTALFASLIGLLFTNLLVHIWANEAVAYTWWGLSGIAYFAYYDVQRKRN